ncbi:MAG: hypothetical protein WB685_23055, partial [Pseudolabrys sp.]
LAVAECAGVAVVQAQTSGDFSSGDFFQFNGSHLRYDKYRGSLFDPLGWEWQRRKAHRRSDGPQASPLIKAKSSSMLAVPRLSENQTVTAGPWAIVPTYKANKLQSCTMSRSDGELGAKFVRAQDGLSVILESQQWKLHRGKAYPVRLTAGSRSVDANARAETKSVIIPLADSTLNSRLRSANNLQVHTEGATLRVPLDSSSTAFERLEECFNSGEAPETNPFLKRNTSGSNPFVAPGRKR